MAESFDQLRAEFLAETEDTLQNLQQDLNELGETMDLDTVPDAPIDRVFRTTHSLKGVAGMFGLTRMSAVSHSLESVFECLRRGDVGLDRELLDLLHRGNDVLHALLAAAASGQEGQEVATASSVIAEIDAALASRLPEDHGVNRSVAEALASLDPEEQQSVRRARELGRNLVVVEATFPEEGFETPFRDLLTAIRNWGTVHGTVSGERRPDDSTFLVQLVATGPQEIFSLMKIVGPLGGEVLIDESGVASDPIDEAVDDVPVAAADAGEPDAELMLEAELQELIDGPAFAPAAPERAAPAPTAGAGDAATHRRAGGDRDRTERSGGESGALRASGGKSTRSSTLRVPVERVDRLMTELGDLIQAKLHLDETADSLLETTDRMSRTMLKQSLRSLDRHIRTIQEGILGVRLVGLDPLFQKLERAFRDACRVTGKNARLIARGETTELDKEIVEALTDPLLHLIRNAVDHGLEPEADRRRAGKNPVGTVELSASTEGSFTLIEVSDDGAGIDFDRVLKRGRDRGLLDDDVTPSRRDLLDLLFHPGFTLKDSATEISGRGVGLDAVRDSAAKLGGTIEIADGEVGTVFRLRVPISLAITQALEVETGGQSYLIPLSHVRRALHARPEDLDLTSDDPVFLLDESAIPVRTLTDRPRPEQVRASQPAVLLGLADRRVLLLVDRVGRRREIVVRSLGELLPDVPGVSGCTELGDGRTLLILDPIRLFDPGWQRPVEVGA